MSKPNQGGRMTLDAHPSHHISRASSPRIPPIWLLGLTNGTFGMYGGFVGIALPQLLAEQHIPQGRVASITALVFTPYFLSFLLSPVLDVRFSRRFYAALLSIPPTPGATSSSTSAPSSSACSSPLASSRPSSTSTIANRSNRPARLLTLSAARTSSSRN